MADLQQNQNRNRNRDHNRNRPPGKAPRNVCPFCRDDAGNLLSEDKRRTVPPGKDGCIICRPKYKIWVEVAVASEQKKKGQTGEADPWSLIVLTTENDEAWPLGFTLVDSVVGDVRSVAYGKVKDGKYKTSLKEHDADRNVVLVLDSNPEVRCEVKVPKGRNFPVEKPEEPEEKQPEYDIKAELYRNPKALSTSGDKSLPPSSDKGSFPWLACVATFVDGKHVDLSFDVLDTDEKTTKKSDVGAAVSGFKDVPLKESEKERTVQFRLHADTTKQYRLTVPAGTDWTAEQKPWEKHTLDAELLGEVDGDGIFHILVQTYKLDEDGKVGEQVNADFIVTFKRRPPITVGKDNPEFKNGVYYVKVEMKVGQEQEVLFHIVGNQADTEKRIVVDALQYKRGAGVLKGAGLLANLFRGLGLEDKR